MLRILVFVATLMHVPAWGAGLQAITNAEAAGGLRMALIEGAGAAVAQLGVENGFFGDPKVRIPLPPALQRIEGALRFAGMRQQADDLVLAMNRAAEAAVPEASALLIEAVQKMTLQDAKGILTGGDTAATDYFRRSTEVELTQRFLPIVKDVTDRAGLAAQYNSLAGQAAYFGLLRERDATIEGYVTARALDGLYLVIAEQERALRKDPLGAASSIVRRVFGAIQ
jgi:hypothetical protein